MLNTLANKSLLPQGLCNSLDHFGTAFVAGRKAMTGILGLAHHVTPVWEALQLLGGRMIAVAPST